MKIQNFLDRLGSCVGIIGTQWGDEGKGKLVDAIASSFDVICRSTGGANAGHSIHVGDKKFVFHLLPSGLLHPQSIGVIGNGTVVSPVDILEEIKALEASGLPNIFDRVKISLHAHLVFDYHKKIDAEFERQKGQDKIGTTCRGIGPCYNDKIARRGIRCEDLLDKDLLLEKIKKNAVFHSQTLGIEINPQEEYEKVISVQEALKPLLCDTRIFLNEAIAQNKKILFEGAQAHHLDIDHGTYPFVTSASVSAGGILTGLGIPPKKIERLIGITKAYTTRVGAGPFPTEMDEAAQEVLREKGHEYGATTSRPRRCGWIDGVMLRNAIVFNGIDELSLTKLDVLTGMKEIKVATAYHLDNQQIYTIPTTRKANRKLDITYETFEGWAESLSGIKRFEDLPKNAQKYVSALESILSCPIGSIGIGIDREDLIFRSFNG